MVGLTGAQRHATGEHLRRFPSYRFTRFRTEQTLYIETPRVNVCWSSGEEFTSIIVTITVGVVYFGVLSFALGFYNQ